MEQSIGYFMGLIMKSTFWKGIEKMKTSKLLNLGLLALSACFLLAACGGEGDNTPRVPRSSLNTTIYDVAIVSPADDKACPLQTFKFEVFSSSAYNVRYTAEDIQLIGPTGSRILTTDPIAAISGPESTIFSVQPLESLGTGQDYTLQIYNRGNNAFVAREYTVITDKSRCSADALRIDGVTGAANALQTFDLFQFGTLDEDGGVNLNVSDALEEVGGLQLQNLIQNLVFGGGNWASTVVFEFNAPVDYFSLAGMQLHQLNPDVVPVTINESFDIQNGCDNTANELLLQSFAPIGPNACIGFRKIAGQVNQRYVVVSLPTDANPGTYLFVATEGMRGELGQKLDTSQGVVVKYGNNNNND